MGDRIIVTEGETLGIRITTEVEIHHMRDKMGTEEMTEALVTVELNFVIALTWQP